MTTSCWQGFDSGRPGRPSLVLVSPDWKKMNIDPQRINAFGNLVVRNKHTGDRDVTEFQSCWRNLNATIDGFPHWLHPSKGVVGRTNIVGQIRSARGLRTGILAVNGAGNLNHSDPRHGQGSVACSGRRLERPAEAELTAFTGRVLWADQLFDGTGFVSRAERVRDHPGDVCRCRRQLSDPHVLDGRQRVAPAHVGILRLGLHRVPGAGPPASSRAPWRGPVITRVSGGIPLDPTGSLPRRLRGRPAPAMDVGAAGGVAPQWRDYLAVIEVDCFEPDEPRCASPATRIAAESPLVSGCARGTTGMRAFYVLNRTTGSSLFPPTRR